MGNNLHKINMHRYIILEIINIKRVNNKIKISLRRFNTAQVISSEEFNNLVEHIEGIAVVDFFATWCGPCKMLAPVFQEVANEFEGKADFYKIDIDASLDIARQFSVSTVPTVIIFRNGEPIERLVGFMPKENLASKIKEYI